MKMVIDISNPARIVHPKEGDVSVVLFDGHKWYVTSKDDLFSEVNKTLRACETKLAELESQNASFKAEIARQMVEISDLMRELYLAKGETK